jgi:hypothetical protein
MEGDHDMERPEITAALVTQIERLLAGGRRHATLAKRLGVTRYVVQLIARNKERIGHEAPPDNEGPRYPNRPNSMDAMTVRMIQRMLRVGILQYQEIAREAGVSSNFVACVARGQRTAIDTSRPPLSPGERFLPVPIRCSVCAALLSIGPCRACAARRQRNSVCCM